MRLLIFHFVDIQSKNNLIKVLSTSATDSGYYVDVVDGTGSIGTIFLW